MRRFVRGILAPNARPVPKRVIRSKKRESFETIASRLSDLATLKEPRILVKRRLGGIGDVIMTTPTVKHIKRVLPNCFLTYATDFTYADGSLRDILKGNPYIDELIEHRTLHRREFDFEVDITTTGLKQEISGTVPPNRIDMFADRVGVDITSDPKPDYYIMDDEIDWAKAKVREILKEKNLSENTKLIAIHVRSNDARRTWPFEYIDKLIDLIDANPKLHPIIFDWKDNYNWNIKATTIMKLDIRLAMALINECALLICPDSGILHLAGALEKNIISIFGTTPPESRINHYKNAVALYLNLPCSACWYSPSSCLKTDEKFKCFRDITPEMVYDATLKRLDNKPIKQNKKEKDLIDKNALYTSDGAILVKRRSGGFGDIAMSLTAIEALAAKYPHYEIHYALPKKYHEAIENCPFVHKVIDIEYPINQKPYQNGKIIDISFPCAYYEAGRVKMHKKVEKSRVEIFAEALKVRAKLYNLRPRYFISEEETKWAKEFLSKTKSPIITLVLKAAEDYRCWPINYYKNLIEKIKDLGTVVVIDPKRGFDLPGTLDACGFSFRKNAAIVGQSNIVVTPDTGHLHIAEALNIPTIALFGPIDSKARCKGYNNITVLTSDLDCIPCWRSANSPCRKNKQLHGYSKCMEELQTERVYKSLLQLLEQQK